MFQAQWVFINAKQYENSLPISKLSNLWTTDPRIFDSVAPIDETLAILSETLI